jgi:hypothetical protein
MVHNVFSCLKDMGRRRVRRRRRRRKRRIRINKRIRYHL